MDPEKELGKSVWDMVSRAAETGLSGTLEVQTDRSTRDVMIFIFPKNEFTKMLEKSMLSHSPVITSTKTFVDPQAN